MIDYDAGESNGYDGGDFHQDDDGAPSIGARILAIPAGSSAGPPVPAMTQPQDFSGAPSSPWRVMDAQRKQQMMATASPQAQPQDAAPAPSFASQTPQAAVPPPAPPKPVAAKPVAAKPPTATPPPRGGANRPQPSNSTDVRVVDRQGNITTIPRSSVSDARKSGKMVTPDNGVRMITPDGQITYALPEEVDQFRASGHVLLKDNGYYQVDPLPGEYGVDTMARAARIGLGRMRQRPIPGQGKANAAGIPALHRGGPIRRG